MEITHFLLSFLQTSSFRGGRKFCPPRTGLSLYPAVYRGIIFYVIRRYPAGTPVAPSGGEGLLGASGGSITVVSFPEGELSLKTSLS